MSYNVLLSSPGSVQETQLLTQVPEEDWALAPDAETVASLIPATANDALRRIDFRRDGPSVVKLGRAPAPDRISFPRCAVMSACHCKIEWSVGPRGLITFTIKDLSSNGTYINSVKRTKGEAGCLSHGDTVWLGNPDTTFHFHQYLGLVPQCAIYDDYDIKDELGQGSYAVVRRGINRRTGKEVAVKISDCTQYLRTPEGRKKMLREITIMRTVRHPNVIHMFDDYLDEPHKRLYLVLELMGGETLLQLISAGWESDGTYYFDELTARSYASQLVDALEYLHSRRIIHRDLKPENILLTGDLQTVKVADFGVSKIDNTASGVHTLTGTPDYLAPEILTGLPYSDSVDSYSLGLVVYNLLTGSEAFAYADAGRKPTDIHAQVRQRKVKWAALEMNEYLSTQSVDFVKRLVVSNPTDRMSMTEAKQHPWILSQYRSDDPYAYASTQASSSNSPSNSQELSRVDMSLDGPSFSIPSATSFLSDASGPAPTPPEPDVDATPRQPATEGKGKVRGASTSPKSRMIRGRNSNADLSMASARSEPPITRKGKRRAASVEREDEPDRDVLPVPTGTKKRKVAGRRGSQEDSVESVVEGRSVSRSRVAPGERPLQRRRSARLSKDA
ncbi:unnamed protein product [Peniophora sp. CBMAI 1063]|nr:unnamed protein product [Peniophora sp. CBMAI 1063]